VFQRREIGEAFSLFVEYRQRLLELQRVEDIASFEYCEE
jgi:hypothetical protein